METINIEAASLISVGLIALIFTDPLWMKLIFSLISFATVYVTAYFKSFDLQKFITSHKSSANKLIAIKDQYQGLSHKEKYCSFCGSPCQYSFSSISLSQPKYIYHLFAICIVFIPLEIFNGNFRFLASIPLNTKSNSF